MPAASLTQLQSNPRGAAGTVVGYRGRHRPAAHAPSLDAAEAAGDLVAFDQIGSFLLRLSRLSERTKDTWPHDVAG